MSMDRRACVTYHGSSPEAQQHHSAGAERARPPARDRPGREYTDFTLHDTSEDIGLKVTNPPVALSGYSGRELPAVNDVTRRGRS